MKKSKISIISSSIRNGRSSHRLALFFEKYIADNQLGTTEILDLKAYDFPLFHERLKFLETPPKNAVEFASKIVESDGIIIVVPEYNGGYPASLKNVIDLLHIEWRNKPVAIVTVSSGSFGGTQALVSLQFSLRKIKAWVITEAFQVANVIKSYNEDGSPIDPSAIEKPASAFVGELLRCAKEYRKEI